MTSQERSKDGDTAPKQSRSSDDAAAQPDWANGLRQLYDSVVDEDIPDSFKDLLSQLDAK